MNRREALDRFLSVFMLGAASGAAGYVYRDELKSLLPPKRYSHWKPAVMVIYSSDSLTTSRGQGASINGTALCTWSKDNGYAYCRNERFEDISVKQEQWQEMKKMAVELADEVIAFVDHDGYFRVFEIPQEIDATLQQLNRAN